MTWIETAYKLPPGCGENLIKKLALPLIWCSPEGFEAKVEQALALARAEAISLNQGGKIGNDEIDLAVIRMILAALKRTKAVMIADTADGGHA